MNQGEMDFQSFRVTGCTNKIAPSIGPGPDQRYGLLLILDLFTNQFFADLLFPTFGSILTRHAG